MGLCGSGSLGVKWPNDVWLGAGKLAGVLLELHGGQSGPHHVVIGIGINVHLPDQLRSGIDQPVADLRSLVNSLVDRNQLTAMVLNRLQHNLEILGQQGFEFFRTAWLTHDVLLDKEVTVTGHGQQFRGTVAGVSPTGALILRTGAGERQITGGEIAPSVRLATQSAMPAGR